MLHLDTKNPSNTHSKTLPKSLLAFKPRQVLLAQHNPTSTTMADSVLKDGNSSKTTSLTPELRRTLHQSILHYLHRNGFSRTLKRFQSEAQVQSDTWQDSSLHLEDIFCKYNHCNDDGPKNTSKELGNDEAIKKDNVSATSEETTKKKKKKGTVGSENGAIKDQLEVTDNKKVESTNNCSQMSEDIIANELETKSKKKKIKHDFDSSGQDEEAKSDASKKLLDDFTEKTKDKKKKDIQQDELGPSTTNEKEQVTEVEQKERKIKKKKLRTDSSVQDQQVNSVRTDTGNETIQSDESRKEKKSSKKRKRSLTDEKENENLAMETTMIDESKHQKTETSKEKKSKKEGNMVNEENAQEISDEQLDRQSNGKLEINGENSGPQKSTKRHRKDSTEPKTVNAFQRVKIDQVEYAHKKLQDNSYWAKDGADIGYGAKAQEVLGQVRGRDFRHEKTKKKRGSYRGGLIDLESRSIKFNYSDEE